jgi:uncharacterized membrane protein YkgB
MVKQELWVLQSYNNGNNISWIKFLRRLPRHFLLHCLSISLLSIFIPKLRGLSLLQSRIDYFIKPSSLFSVILHQSHKLQQVFKNQSRYQRQERLWRLLKKRRYVVKRKHRKESKGHRWKRG